MSAAGLLLSRSPSKLEIVKFQMVKTYLDVPHHSEMQRNRFLDVNITRGIANFVQLAVASCLHAGFVMIKSVTIQWTGNVLPFMAHLILGWLLYT